MVKGHFCISGPVQSWPPEERKRWFCLLVCIGWLRGSTRIHPYGQVEYWTKHFTSLMPVSWSHTKGERLKSGSKTWLLKREVPNGKLPQPLPTSLLPRGLSLPITLPQPTSTIPEVLGGPWANSPPSKGLPPTQTPSIYSTAPQKWTVCSQCSIQGLRGVGVDSGHGQRGTGTGQERAVKKGHREEALIQLPDPKRPLFVVFSGFIIVLISTYEAELWCSKSPYITQSHIQDWQTVMGWEKNTYD